MSNTHDELTRLRAMEERARHLAQTGYEDGVARPYRHAARFILGDSFVPEPDMNHGISEWTAQMRSFLGHHVEVLLNREDSVTIDGILLGFTDDGEVLVQEEDGTHRWAWPNLETRQIAIGLRVRRPELPPAATLPDGSWMTTRGQADTVELPNPQRP